MARRSGADAEAAFEAAFLLAARSGDSLACGLRGTRDVKVAVVEMVEGELLLSAAGDLGRQSLIERWFRLERLGVRRLRELEVLCVGEVEVVAVASAGEGDVAPRPRTTTRKWYSQQCGGCSFYVPLAGDYGYDWGVCTNNRSSFDRRAMFEHDGWHAFKSAGDMVGR